VCRVVEVRCTGSTFLVFDCEIAVIFYILFCDNIPPHKHTHTHYTYTNTHTHTHTHLHPHTLTHTHLHTNATHTHTHYTHTHTNAQGDIEDLCLTFSVSETDMGTQKEVDLVHLGSKIAVSAVHWSYRRLYSSHC
jgi:hypothetical protein